MWDETPEKCGIYLLILRFVAHTELPSRDECGQILQLRDDGILALLTYRPYTATIRKIDKLT